MLLFGDDINLNISNLFLFILSVIGFTHIIVDPATIAKPFRNFIDKYGNEWIKKLFSCYQCCGTWIGFFCGFILISKNIFVIFLCGMAGSFISTWGAYYLNYLEAKTLVLTDSDNE